MRIALVSDWFLPRVGGVEQQMSGLARELGARGHHVCVITATPGPDDEGGIPVHRLRYPAIPGWRAMQRALEPIGFHFFEPLPRIACREIDRIIVDERIDVVHGHSVFSMLAHFGMLAARRRGIGGVLTNHSLLERAGLILFRALDEVCSWPDWAGVLSAVGQNAARELALVSRRPVRVIPNGITPSAWRASKTRSTARRVVSVMRLNHRKSPSALLAAMARLRDELDGSSPRLVIFGDGPLRGSLERETAELDLVKQVEFRGFRGREEIAREFARADVFALPGSRESFGIAAAEALAAGLPVVGMRGCGVEDVVAHGEEGLLARDASEFAEMLLRAVTDHELRARLATNAPTRIGRFGWDAVTDAYLGAYRDACEAVRA